MSAVLSTPITISRLSEIPAPSKKRTRMAMTKTLSSSQFTLYAADEISTFSPEWGTGPRTGTRLGSQCHLTVMVLRSLDTQPYELRDSVHVVVEQIANDNYLASFPLAGIHASGDTKGEAVANLKDIIAAKMQFYSSLRDDQLGPVPRRQLDVLRQVLRGLE